MMERRSFFNVAASAVAAIAGANSDLYASITGNYDEKRELSEILSGLDTTVDKIVNEKRLESHEDFFRDRKLSPFLLQEVLVALTVRATYDKIDRNQRTSPIVASMLMQYAPVLDRAVLGMTTFIESIDQKEREEITKNLKINEQEIDDIQKSFFQKAQKEPHSYSGGALRANRIFKNTLWRMRRQGIGSVIETSVAEVDRVGIRFGVDSQKRRDNCIAWSKRTSFFENDATMVAGEAGDGKLSENSKIGLIMLGLGFLFAVLCIVIDTYDDQSIGFLFGFTGGVVVMIIGLVVVLSNRDK